MTTAAWPLQVALYDAITADAPTRALVTGQGVYNGVAPEGAALDYIVLGEPTESRFDALMQPGNDGTLRLHVYTADVSHYAALAIYAALSRVLDGTRLPLSGGHAMLSGALTLETSRAEDGGRHLIARYAALTRETA